MKKVLSGILIGMLMLVSYVAGRKHSQQPGSAAANSGRRVLYWVDPMHPDYRSDYPGTAPDCGMALEPVYAEAVSASNDVSAEVPPGSVAIDSEKQQLFGIRLTDVQRTSGSDSVRALGHVLPEDTRIYKLNSGMEGFIRETFNDSVGEFVKKDQKLATFYGSESLAVASGYLAATAAVPGSVGKDGARTVPFPGAVSKQGLSSVQGYADRLRNLGMSEVQIKEMAEDRQLPESVDIVSPVDGFILSRNITAGEHFDRSMEFYRVADLRRVWIVTDIYASEAQGFRPGAIAHITLPDRAKTLTARVTNVLPQVDPTTRIMKLRLEADNPDFVLRPDMFVDVELPISMPAGLTIPVDALIDSGREQRVYVERSRGIFEPRLVEVGWRYGDRVQIVRGLNEGERVVSAGTFLVNSESRLKSGQPSPKEQPKENVPPGANTGSRMAFDAGSVKDPACGMSIDSAKAAAEGNTLMRNGVTYYFCSDRCKQKFGKEPEHYLASNPSGRRP